MKQKRWLFLAAMPFWAALILCFQGCAAGIFYCKGNQFGDNKKIVAQLKKEHPHVKEIVKIERNFYEYSIITAREEDGKIVPYCLNTSILLDHEFKVCEKQ